MDEDAIQKRLLELAALHKPIYEEEFKLRELLIDKRRERFRDFLRGKQFEVTLSTDFEFLYLENKQFHPSELFSNGIDQYHESFSLERGIEVYVDDGNISISSGDFPALMSYAEKMGFSLSLSKLTIMEKKVRDLLSIIESITSPKKPPKKGAAK